MTPQQKLVSDLATIAESITGAARIKDVAKRGQLTEQQWQHAAEALGQIQTALDEIEAFFADKD